MNGIQLTGLEGTNPLGFLAALGVQVAFASESDQPRLWWSEGITPRAIVDMDFTPDRIAARVLEACSQWKDSPAVNPRRSDNSELPKGDELKLAQADIREYLAFARDNTPAAFLSSALVAEGSLAKTSENVAKPSDLYFTAGQQSFMKIVRDVLSNVSRDEVINGLEGPWSYENNKLSTLGWDITDDRVYALRANNPAPEQKPTNPGPEALAIMGLSLHPVFAGRNGTLTQGCSGKWKAGHYSWPIWKKPASLGAVKSLLAHAYTHERTTAAERHGWLRSWGVIMLFRSPIRRSPQGGYGTFGPPGLTWR